MALDSLESKIGSLKEEVLKMGILLQEQICKSNQALVEKNLELAQEVIANDDLMDEMEFAIEKECLSLIALQQPMAKDLRFIGTALRIIVDLERMGDHAEDIAEMTIALYDQPYMKPLIDIPRMARIAEDMVKIALQAFVDEDCKLVMELVPMEKEIDRLNDVVFRDLVAYMMKDQNFIPQSTSLLLVAGHLERIADHATNVGEMVIYSVEGRRIDLNVMARK